MYIVTIDRPYYPSVTYCATHTEAVQERDRLVADAYEDGEHECKVCIALVEEVVNIRTHY